MLTVSLPIFGPVNQLATIIPFYVGTMPKFYMLNYGPRLIDLTVDFVTYVDLANTEESIVKREGFLKTLSHKIFKFKTLFRVCVELSRRGSMIIDEKGDLSESFKKSQIIFTKKQIANISFLINSISKQCAGWLSQTKEKKKENVSRER